MASAALRLGKLLGNSFTFLKTHAALIAMGVAVFGIVTTAVKVTVLERVAPMMIMTMTGQEMSVEKLQDLQVRAEAGDESAQAEIMLMAETLSQNMGEGMIRNLPKIILLVGALALVSALLLLIAHGFFLNLALKPKSSFQTVLWNAVKFIFPLIGIGIWSFIRSWVWLPIVAGIALMIVIGVSNTEIGPSAGIPFFVLAMLAAVILSFVYYPRFTLAPVIYLQDRKGVMASVDKSYKETRGYWGKIVGNLIVVGIIGAVLLMLLNGILQIAFGPLSPVSVFFGNIFQFAFIAYQIVFLVKLSLTIREHPIR